MTALAGVWRWAAGRPGPADCERMLRVQQSFAPDPPTIWSDGGMALGRRLFKTVPEDRFDAGPLVSADGRRVLIADVRLDNRGELLDALGLPPAEARIWADSRLLMEALERWGEESLDRIAGDFAFAYWDASRQRLLLARDPLGNRPLHFFHAPGLFALASMPKGLHALEEVPRAPDVEHVTRFLALLPETGTGTFYRAVKRVPPAHLCILGRGGPVVRRYWNPGRAPLRLRRASDYRDAVRESLDRAVASCLRGAEGKVAAHLSSGLDSGAVAATAARLLGPGGRVVGFTSVPRDGYEGAAPPGYFADEGPLAAQVAAMYPQIEQVLVRAGGRPPTRTLDRNVFLFDRPVLSLCNVAWNEAICDGARQRGLRILLTGTMGNLSFSYGGLEGLPELVRRGRLLRLGRELGGLHRHGFGWKAALSAAFGPYMPAPVWKALSRLRGRDRSVSGYSSVNPATAERLAGEASADGLRTGFRPRRDPLGARLAALAAVDFGNFNKGGLAGWGLDQRDPTGDRRLIELCLSIPAERFLANGRPRALARAVLADRLPAAVLEEPRRGKQAIDWHEGLCEARAEIEDEVGRFCRMEEAEALFDTARLRRLLDDWPEGGWHSDGVENQYRHALLRGVSAGHFVRKTSGSNV